MAGRIAVIGSTMVDLVTYVTRMPVKGETVEAPSFEMGFGGKGANQAVAAAKLGADVMMLAKVGDDMFADNTVANLAAHGIDTRHVRRVHGRSSGVAPIFVEPSGENSILIVKGANNDLLPADIEAAAEDLARCSLILLQLEVPVETVYAAIEFGRRHGVETLLNPAPAVGALDPERIRHATFLVPNETELAILSGMPVETEREILAAARHLIAKGIRTVIVTMGGRGALLVTIDAADPVAPVPVTPGRYDWCRRRVYRQLCTLLCGRTRPETVARSCGAVRGRFDHKARHAEGLCDRGRFSHGVNARCAARSEPRPAVRMGFRSSLSVGYPDVLHLGGAAKVLATLALLGREPVARDCRR